MPWTAAAIVGSAGIGYLGAKEAGKNKGGLSAQEQIDADIRANNPNINNPFGGSRTYQNEDGTYNVQQTLTPEMEAMTNRLMGMAGSSRGTFDSGGMPEHLQNIYAQKGAISAMDPGDRQDYNLDMRNAYTGSGDAPRLPDDLSGFMPTQASYDRPQYGFGEGEGALVDPLADGQSPYTDLDDMEAIQYIIEHGLTNSSFSNDEAMMVQKMLGSGTPGTTGFSNATDSTISDWAHPDDHSQAILDFKRLVDRPGAEYSELGDLRDDRERIATLVAGGATRADALEHIQYERENGYWEYGTKRPGNNPPATAPPQGDVFAGGGGFNEAEIIFDPSQPDPSKYNTEAYGDLITALAGASL
jgi:hypothetical protein